MRRRQLTKPTTINKKQRLVKAVEKALPWYDQWKRKWGVPYAHRPILALLAPEIEKLKETYIKWERSAINEYLNNKLDCEIQTKLRKQGLPVETTEALHLLLWKGEGSFRGRITEIFLKQNSNYCPFCSDGKSGRMSIPTTGNICECQNKKGELI